MHAIAQLFMVKLIIITNTQCQGMLNVKIAEKCNTIHMCIVCVCARRSVSMCRHVCMSVCESVCRPILTLERYLCRVLACSNLYRRACLIIWRETGTKRVVESLSVR